MRHKATNHTLDPASSRVVLGRLDSHTMTQTTQTRTNTAMYAQSSEARLFSSSGLEFPPIAITTEAASMMKTCTAAGKNGKVA